MEVDKKMHVIVEYFLAFVLIYIINYFVSVRNNTKYKKDKAPPELIYLKKIYNINLKKINYRKFVYINAFLNTFIISTIYIIIIYLIPLLILRIVVGIILLILMIIICYGLLARYYLWKENEK